MLAACLAGAALKKVKQEDITKISVVGAAFFVSSLIHFKVGFSSVHLTLIGLVGIILGIHSSLAIITGLFFQAVMFHHGGLSTLGVNSVLFSVPALIVYGIFDMVYKRVKSQTVLGVLSGILSGGAIVLALLFVIVILHFSGEELLGFAYFFSLSNGVLALVEGVVTALAIMQICRVKPQMLRSCRQ